MSALLDAYNLLADPINPLGLNPDYVFNYFVPDTMPDGTPKENVQTLVLLTNIQGNPTNYASNQSRELVSKIQVQIWFEYTDPLAEQYEGLLRTYFETNSFQEYYFLVDKDPDLDKLFLTAKFIKIDSN